MGHGFGPASSPRFPGKTAKILGQGLGRTLGQVLVLGPCSGSRSGSRYGSSSSGLGQGVGQGVGQVFWPGSRCGSSPKNAGKMTQLPGSRSGSSFSGLGQGVGQGLGQVFLAWVKVWVKSKCRQNANFLGHVLGSGLWAGSGLPATPEMQAKHPNFLGQGFSGLFLGLGSCSGWVRWVKLWALGRWVRLWALGLWVKLWALGRVRGRFCAGQREAYRFQEDSDSMSV